MRGSLDIFSNNQREVIFLSIMLLVFLTLALLFVILGLCISLSYKNNGLAVVQASSLLSQKTVTYCLRT